MVWRDPEPMDMTTEDISVKAVATGKRVTERQ